MGRGVCLLAALLLCLGPTTAGAQADGADAGQADGVDATASAPEPGEGADEPAAAPTLPPAATAVGNALDAAAAGAVKTTDPPSDGVSARPAEAEAELESSSSAGDIDAELIGKRISQISFDCDLPVCENPIGVDAFRAIMGLYIGQQYETDVLRRAERRLAKTGFFDRIQVTKTLGPGGVSLAIYATGATLIRKVVFDGVEAPPFESELRKLMSYRQGQAFRNDPDKATAQLDSMKALYEREGYFGTQISMVVKAVEEESHLVDLVFRIEKGNRRRICAVGVRGVKAMTYQEARDLLLSDFSFLPRRLAVFPLYFTAEGFKDGQQALIAEYRSRGYYQARIVQKATSTDAEGACVTLAVDVVEGPRWTVDFNGGERFSADQLLAELPFNESGYVDAEEIRRGERAIAKLYETRGYPFATVKGRESKRDRLERLIEFEIDEGPQLEIAEIVIHGNKAFGSDELLENLGTQPFGLFETGGYLQTDQLLGDFGRIEEKYRERGFLQATVDRFELEVLEDSDAMRIHVHLVEGTRTLIQRVDIDGNRIVPDGTLRRDLGGQRGFPFVPLTLKGDLTKLLQRYSRLGYPMAAVKTTCRLLTGEKVPCESPRLPRGCLARALEELDGQCRWTEGASRRFVCERRVKAEQCEFSGGVYKDRVHVIHKITEGPRVTVGPILLKGNFDTASPVIYREVPLQRHDLLDTQLVIEGQGNLRSLNLFDSVSIESIGLDEGVVDDDETTAALLIGVEETRTKSFEFEVGLELRDVLSDVRQFLITGEVEYRDRNLFGRGFGIQPRLISAIDTLDIVRLATEATSADLSRSDVQTVDFVVGSEVILSHPRFLKSATGVDKLYATLSPFYVLDLVGVINRQVLREEGGVRVELRKELFELLSRLFLKFGVEVKSIASFAPDGPVIDGRRVFSPRRTVGKLTPDLALDRRDSPLNPTKGYFARIEPAVVSGDAFGKGGERFVNDAFGRITASFSLYLPLWRDYVLGQGFRAGQIFPLFGRQTPIQADELYFLGGVSSVRGFTDGAMGPFGARQRPSGGEFMLNYNAELRYPLLKEYSLYGATFFDAGLLADCRVDDTDDRHCYQDAFGGSPLESIRYAAGIGVRALVLDQIPVVLDYGIILNRVPGERFGQVHFNVGYTFE